MYIITHRTIFYTISGILIAASVSALALWDLNLGIDFKGGALLEVSYVDTIPEKADIEKILTPIDAYASVRPVGEVGYLIRLREITEDEHIALLTSLSFGGAHAATEVRFDSIGPLLGKEAALKSLLAIALVIICIVLFITYAFRKVSEPVSSWKYGIITIVALLHDVLIPVGVFAYLGHFAGVEIDTLFVTALLVVLGFSVHDTIVVFDRVRENLRLNHTEHLQKPFEQVVGEGISATLGRSINTSLTTIIALIVLYFIGPVSTQYFSLALIIGIIAGTYSSICIASPLLVTVEKRQTR
ncbi:MAG: protein-export membrane protein SecF [Candidatus Taylorbacteria bacterium RIFCSPHIGHO2_02_FULL_47_18]|nr:MAG: protein-export membrane protein SecF [Candidatus Taylorbacteria bacterium RIFCSPHIGHO2_02_FULL_47_18]OHA40783.1 MAG: protein-export membrane protein SecF [Candidatus Taylorbacteria bacterium RIFCSPLOWO2_02_FULL_48_16]OHA45356.1 MAG: protein-export membrane protein SecF [Candidatus Taylorbacteria bacterium RIFCSPLOWO2_12_FULL_48_11]